MDSLIPFSPVRVERLRRRAQKACPVCGDAPEGWSRADADFGPLLAAFPPLALRDGFALCGYRFMAGANGNAVIWALPVGGGAAPDPVHCMTGVEGIGGVEGVEAQPAGVARPARPRPPGAVPVPEALHGDGSPWSYLCASILIRELGDFGAVSHGRWWGTHVMLCADPWTGGAQPSARRAQRARRTPDPLSWPGRGREEWCWLAAPPDDWRPAYRVDGDGRPAVSFYTYSGLGRETIYRHDDTYVPGSYVFSPTVSSVAEGGPGFFF
ncbi:MAG: hypothetical protein Q8P31_02930 [Bacillota bacterium]|nr:hypothetical protein [Bacillota bacterium]